MKKKIVTYGVHGMMEFQAIIKIGRSVMKVLFTDGSMNAMGENPATYTTNNLMVQHAIENSDHFKRGRIHMVRTVLLDEDVHIERNSKRERIPAQGIEEISNPKSPFVEDKETEEAINEADAKGISANETIQKDHYSEEEPSHSIEEALVTVESELGNKELTEMEFDNNDDARDFLEEKFGYVRSKLRNRADIVAAGEAHNIAISFS